MLTTFPLETYEQRMRRKLDDLISKVFGAPFGRVFSPPFGPRLSTAEIIPWYTLFTSGLAAFQPLGAASYAASKVNLLNPGTNDAADGTAYPTWDASYGWGMASASLQYLTVGSGALTTATPLTIAALFKPDNVTRNNYLATIARNATSIELFALTANGTQPQDHAQAQTWQAGAVAVADTTAGFSAATWQTFIAVFSAANARAVYLNGANKGTETTSKTPQSLNLTLIGAYYNGATSAFGGYPDGQMAAIGFDGAAPDDAGVLALHNAMIALVT